MSEELAFKKVREDRLIDMAKKPEMVPNLINKIQASGGEVSAFLIARMDLLKWVKSALNWIDGEHRIGFQIIDMDLDMQGVDWKNGPSDESWTVDQIEALVVG